MCKRRIAWRAIHIACDVGNRVHTRHDSDEDVRGNACKQTIALWFYLGLYRLYSSLFSPPPSCEIKDNEIEQKREYPNQYF